MTFIGEGVILFEGLGLFYLDSCFACAFFLDLIKLSLQKQRRQTLTSFVRKSETIYNTKNPTILAFWGSAVGVMCFLSRARVVLSVGLHVLQA